MNARVDRWREPEAVVDKELNHTDTGPALGNAALVLLHPLGGSLHFWDEAIRRWRARYRVVAYDRAGSGHTRAPDTPHSMSESVAELETLRSGLGLGPIIPVGVAIGAMIAAAYAAARPQCVASLVLCNPALKVGPAGRAMTLERVKKLRAGGVEALLPDAVDRAFNGVPKGQAYARYLELFRANDAQGYELSALGSLELDITEDLDRIRTRTLVLSGEHDILFPPSDAAEVARRVAGATLGVVPDAAHFPPIQNPDAFVRAVDAFLR